VGGGSGWFLGRSVLRARDGSRPQLAGHHHNHAALDAFMARMLAAPALSVKRFLAALYTIESSLDALAAPG